MYYAAAIKRQMLRDNHIITCSGNLSKSHSYPDIGEIVVLGSIEERDNNGRLATQRKGQYAE